MKMYEFLEPHVTGGHSRVTISECNIIKYMKEKIVPKNKVLSDKELVESFCADYWAKPYVDLERQLEEAERRMNVMDYYICDEDRPRIERELKEFDEKDKGE